MGALMKPIVLGEHFQLTDVGLRVRGRPTFEEWQGVGDALRYLADAAPYAIGEWLNYGESREDWRERLSQAMTVTGYKKQTLLNLSSVVRRVPEENRRISPSPEHSAAVAPLPVAEQREWLERAASREMSIRDLRMEMRADRRRGVIEGQAVLEGQYRALIVDAPWRYKRRQPSGSSQADHYGWMTIEELCALGPMIQSHAAAQAVGFFWVTAPFLYYATDPTKGPDPYRFILACGFLPKTGMVWHKRRHNFGHYVAVRHEHVIIATRGSCTPDRPTPMIDSVFSSEKAPQEMEHSEKPEELRQHVERLYDGPYCEIFARRPVEGWATFGDDLRIHKEVRA